MTPQIPNFALDGITKPQILAKKWIFFRNS